MSRIGNKVIVIPAGVSVEVNGATVTVKGPKGELVRSFNENITLDIAENEITVKRPNDTKEMKMLHGTTRALLANMVEGVSTGFSKALEMIGVGYRAQLQGTKLVLSVGKSHQDEVPHHVNTFLYNVFGCVMVFYRIKITDRIASNFVLTYELKV